MDAIVLAGGASRRMGGADKPAQLVGDRSLLQRAVDAAAGSAVIVVVGPRRSGVDGVVWCREEPPGGGPVAAIAAGLQHTQSDMVLVLAGDLPDIAGAVAPLAAAVGPAECAVLVDAAGQRNPLAAAWQRAALVRALGALPNVRGARAMSLLDAVNVAEVQDAGRWGADCDTAEELDAARRRADVPTTGRTP